MKVETVSSYPYHPTMNRLFGFVVIILVLFADVGYWLWAIRLSLGWFILFSAVGIVGLIASALLIIMASLFIIKKRY